MALKSRLVLIDGMNLVYRSHYACRGLQNSEGHPTGVLHGFLRSMLKLKPHGPIVVCWDSTKARWRDKIYPAYKANRTDSPDKAIVRRQLEPLRLAISLMGIPQIEVDSLEADDLIALLSQQQPCWIYSNDRDLYQLLSPTIGVLDKDFKPIPISAIEKAHGLPVVRWAEYLAIGGDGSDNIRPLPKCGPKTAIKLIQAGARVMLPWAKQPITIRGPFAKYESHWPEVHKAYEVVRLPLTVADPRIQSVGSLFEERWAACKAILSQEAKVSESRLWQFTQFCSKFELLEIMSKRREFFNHVPARESSTGYGNRNQGSFKALAPVSTTHS